MTTEPKENASTAIIEPSTMPCDHSDIHETVHVGIEATSLPPFNAKDELIEASEEFFTNVEGYITSEIDLTLDDYKLLETMNNITVEKYQDMSKIATKVAQSITDLDQKYKQMMPKLEIIDKLDKKVTQLEKLAYAIDAYSKRLEKQYKMLEKRVNVTGQLPES